MTDYKKVYEEWLANPYFDNATKEELRNIADDEKEIKERFYADLEFGGASRDYWGGHKPYEYVYGSESYPGIGKLYYVCGRKGQGSGHCV